jgi:hypothetical protein
MTTRLLRRFFIMCSMLPALCACGGGGSSPAPNSFVAPTPTPTIAPTAPPGGTVALSQTVLAFSAPGQTATVTVSEPGYTGAIAANAGACGVVAAVSPPTATSSPAQFTVTSQTSGSCAITFTDSFGQAATLTVGVTITQGTIQ